MKKKDYVFLASADIARRAGVVETSYVVADGRFVMTDKELRRVELSGDEYAHGLPIEEVTCDEARRLVKENGYKTGSSLSVGKEVSDAEG